MTIIRSTKRPVGIDAVGSYRENGDGTYSVHPRPGADLISLARKLGTIEMRHGDMTVADLLAVLSEADPELLVGYRSDYRSVSAKRATVADGMLVLS